MKCPICKADLSPLDLVSRHEHATFCLENGPTIIDFDDNSGQTVLKKIIPLNKQRKICPVCDKTFQSIHLHYKKCALKNDILPEMMLGQWDQLNRDLKTTKTFPPDLLENFISRRVKEGLAGEQVEYARVLLLSMAESQPVTSNRNEAAARSFSVIQQQQDIDVLVIDDSTNGSTISNSNPQIQRHFESINDNQTPGSSMSCQGMTLNQVLMRNAPDSGATKLRKKQTKQFKIELVDEAIKKINIQIRMEQEMAVSNRIRFDKMQAALEAQIMTGEEGPSTKEDEYTIDWLDRLT